MKTSLPAGLIFRSKVAYSCIVTRLQRKVILTAAATKVRSTASLIGFIALVAINPSESELLKAVAYIGKTQLFCKYNLMLSEFVSSRLANKCLTYRISFRDINPQHSLYYLSVDVTQVPITELQCLSSLLKTVSSVVTLSRRATLLSALLSQHWGTCAC